MSSSTHTIYGIRMKGEHEVRYVGLTQTTLAKRLRQHITIASVVSLGPWIQRHAENVEIFPIAKFDSREKAMGAERVIIAVCASLGHRLFNRSDNPCYALGLPDARRPDAEHLTASQVWGRA